MDEQTFRDTAARDGYAEPVIVEWDADTFNDSHTHDFAARIFVLAGLVDQHRQLAADPAGQPPFADRPLQFHQPLPALLLLVVVDPVGQVVGRGTVDRFVLEAADPV